MEKTRKLASYVAAFAAAMALALYMTSMAYAEDQAGQHIDNVKVTVAAPICGDKVAYKDFVLPISAQPKVTLPSGAGYSVMVEQDAKVASWGTFNSIDDFSQLAEGGKIEGGKTYDVAVVLKAKPGYFFDEATAASAANAINGKSPIGVVYDSDETALRIYGSVKAVHKWNAGKVTTMPTLKKKGVKTYTCKACGATKTEAVAKQTAVTVPSGKKLTFNGKTRTGVKAGANYTVSGNTAKAAGTYKAKLVLKDKVKYAWADGTTKNKTVKWTIAKAKNPLKVEAKKATVKYSDVKKAAQKLDVTEVIEFAKEGKGKMTYTKVSGNKKIAVNAKTGKVTVKKGLKKGAYKVTVKVKAAGGKNYKASAWKTVEFTVKVK